MKKISIENSSRFCALVIGPAGIGKTSLLRTILGQAFNPQTGAWEQAAEPSGRICTLSAESGLLCVRDLVASGHVEGFEIGTFQEFREAQTYFMQKEFEQRYQWIFIDSLTEISARCVESAKAKFPAGSDTFKV